MTARTRADLATAERIVVKVGSSSISGESSWRIPVLVTCALPLPANALMAVLPVQMTSERRLSGTADTKPAAMWVLWNLQGVFWMALTAVAVFVPHLLADAGVVHVEVRLELVEAVEVVLAGLLVERPRPLLDAGEHDAALRVGRALLRPHVPVVELGARIARGLEPRVGVGGVVDDEVDQHPHAAGVGLPHELDEVPARAEPAVDPVEVGDVVASVAPRRRLERS